MVEIPVRHKKKSLLPLWLLPVALAGVLGAGVGLSRANTGHDHTAITSERTTETMVAAPTCRSRTTKTKLPKARAPLASPWPTSGCTTPL